MTAPLERFKAIRADLAKIEPWPLTNIEKWVQRATPLIAAHFPQHGGDFKEITTLPEKANLPADESNHYEVGEREIEIDERNGKKKIKDIGNYLDSLIELESSSSTTLKRIPTSEDLDQIRQLNRELEAAVFGSRVFEIARKSAVFISKVFPNYATEAVILAMHNDEMHIRRQLKALFAGMIMAESSQVLKVTYPTTEPTPMPDTSTPSGRKMFVSHASKDTAIVNPLIDLLKLTTGLTSSDIFSTSDLSTGVENGDDFVEVIRQNISDCKTVLFVLSPAYFESQFCLVELGAAWALAKSRPFILLIPPTSYGDLKGVLANKQAGFVNDEERLTHFYETLTKELGIPPQITAFETRKKSFVKTTSEHLAKLQEEAKKNPKPPTAEEFKAIQAKYDDATKELEKAFAKEAEQTKLIEAIKAAKDRTEVAAIEAEFTDETERQEYDKLVKAVKESLSNVPSITQVAMFKRFSKQVIHESEYDRDKWTDEIDKKYLLNRGSLLTPNDNELSVKNAQATLKALEAFLKNCSEPLSSTLQEELGYMPEVDNGRYWDDVFLGNKKLDFYKRTS